MHHQIDYFNAMAEKWDEICCHDPKKINLMLDMLDIREGISCLDAGTGTGVLIPYLLQRIGEHGNIAAIDVAEKMLKVAQKKYNYPNVTFILGDALGGSLLADAYDAVICYSVFPHFKDKMAAVRILSQRLKTGGKLLISHSQSRDQINRLHQNASEAVMRDFLPEMKEITSYMEAAGMKVLGWVDNEDMFAIVAEKERLSLRAKGYAGQV